MTSLWRVGHGDSPVHIVGDALGTRGRGPGLQVGPAWSEDGGRRTGGEIRSGLGVHAVRALLLFLSDHLSTECHTDGVVDLEGHCGRGPPSILFLLVPARLFRFENSPTLCPCGRAGVRLHGRWVAEIWPNSGIRPLGHSAWRRHGPAWMKQSRPGDSLLEHLRKKFSIHWNRGEEMKCA